MMTCGPRVIESSPSKEIPLRLVHSKLSSCTARELNNVGPCTCAEHVMDVSLERIEALLDVIFITGVTKEQNFK